MNEDLKSEQVELKVSDSPPLVNDGALPAVANSPSTQTSGSVVAPIPIAAWHRVPHLVMPPFSRLLGMSTIFFLVAAVILQMMGLWGLWALGWQAGIIVGADGIHGLLRGLGFFCYEHASSLALLQILMTVYLLPFFVGVCRSVSRWKLLFAINLLVGWNIVGWLVSLGEAFRLPRRAEAIKDATRGGLLVSILFCVLSVLAITLDERFRAVFYYFGQFGDMSPSDIYPFASGPLFFDKIHLVTKIMLWFLAIHWSCVNFAIHGTNQRAGRNPDPVSGWQAFLVSLLTVAFITIFQYNLRWPGYPYLDVFAHFFYSDHHAGRSDQFGVFMHVLYAAVVLLLNYRVFAALQPRSLKPSLAAVLSRLTPALIFIVATFALDYFGLNVTRDESFLWRQLIVGGAFVLAFWFLIYKVPKD